MKKLFLITVIMGLGASMYGQGTVFFSNTSSTLVTTNTIAIGGTSGNAKTTASGGDVRVALYWGVSGSVEAQLVQIGSSAGIQPTSGRFNNGIYTTGNATAPGEMATFQVRAWTGNYTTYEAAYAGLLNGDGLILLGSTPVFNSITGGAGAPPSGAAFLSDVIPAFSLVAVPEPSTYAILGVGLFGLVWKPLRRMVSK